MTTGKRTRSPWNNPTTPLNERINNLERTITANENRANRATTDEEKIHYHIINRKLRKELTRLTRARRNSLPHARQEQP